MVAVSVASKREGFVKFGTMFSPDLKRATGKPAPRCPDSHPFAFHGGSHCCRLGTQSLDCEQGELKFTSELQCCPEEVTMECPEESGLCYDSKNAGLYVTNSCTLFMYHVIRGPFRQPCKNVRDVTRIYKIRLAKVVRLCTVHENDMI